MRRIIARELYSADGLKKDVLIVEQLEGAFVRRRCTYSVSEERVVSSLESAARWGAERDERPPELLRSVWVRTKRTIYGAEEVVYKVRGRFYVVMGGRGWLVRYRHMIVCSQEEGSHVRRASVSDVA